MQVKSMVVIKGCIIRTGIAEDAETLEASYYAGGDVKWYSPVLQFLKRLNTELLYDPEFPQFSKYPRNENIFLYKNTHMNVHRSII